MILVAYPLVVASAIAASSVAGGRLLDVSTQSARVGRKGD
jgi:hypothetical protein